MDNAWSALLESCESHQPDDGKKKGEGNTLFSVFLYSVKTTMVIDAWLTRTVCDHQIHIGPPRSNRHDKNMSRCS